MKKLLFLFVLSCLFPSVSQLKAQKIKWENDTVYKGNIPYCLLKKSGGLETVFSLQNMRGTEFALAALDKDVKNENGYPYYRVTFIGDKQIADFPNGFNLGKKLAQAIVENDLLQNDSLNPAGESRFLILYPQKQSAQINNVIVQQANTNIYKMAARDRKGMIFVNGASIRQSNVEIGSCVQKDGASNGKPYKTVSFYLPNGTKCAEATVEGSTSHSFTIHTFKNDSAHTFEVQNMAMIKEELAKWLVDNYYL